MMVWQGSTAASRNSGNSWATGQVALTDDDAGRAGVTVENLVPGRTGQKCIVVTSSSTAEGEVRAYVQNLSGSAAGPEDRITLQVEGGTAGSFDDCTGFTPVPGALPAQPLSILARVNSDYTSGGAAWDTTGTAGESSTYRGTWTFDTAGMAQAQIDALQGSRVIVDLVWDLQGDDAPAA
ncbi:hypothetical protein [Kocuria sp.]|uniref:hypothetical protein n=1 Tax=Kocuria sp. TaxID=1871328 RepID=UPI002811BCDF|nr:hypothetical protein [Kocuria sp.]